MSNWFGIAALILVPGMSLATDINTKLTEDSLAKIQFEQKLGAPISPELEFVDDTGSVVRLGDYFGHKPTILVLGYYGCPMLCTLVLNGVADCLSNLGRKSGEQYNVIFASIDPAEKPSLAAEKKRSYSSIYKNCDVSQWHFLTGGQNSITTLAKEIGFDYAYDSSTKQFAHPSGFVVVTGDGRVARYFFGVNFSATEVNKALKDATTNKTGPAEIQFTLLCFHFATVHGRYGKLIVLFVRVGGLLTMAILAGLFFIPSRRGGKFPEK